MAIKITEIKKELMGKIDKKSPMEVEKVERYCNFVNTLRELQKNVEDEGATVVTENGSQRFIKAHPALNEMNKINSQLLNIEKSFNFPDGEEITDKVSLI